MRGTSLGIMVCKVKNNLFHEHSFYRLLQTTGAQRNMLTFVFYPDQIDWSSRKVTGFYYSSSAQQWKQRKFPLPQFIYDRCFYTSSKDYLYYQPYISNIKKDKTIHFLGNGLNGKWQVYQILSKDHQFKNFLPLTIKYRNIKQLLTWLQRFPVIIKPIGGSHGKGVIKVFKQNDNFHIIGRNHHNQKISFQFSNINDFSNFIKNFTQKGRFLIQQYLTLTTSQNNPYDIRVLIQKNQYGQWETTGMAARLGDANNITSNLHGGGRVEPVINLLTTQFGNFKAKTIINEINLLAQQLPPFIESAHGDLIELGLDIGVDQEGGVWIIEVNSKPGRSVFELLNDEETSKRSSIMPILYAEFLNKKKIGGNVI